MARVLERSCAGMSLAQYRLLAMVARGDERASHLAGRLALARPSVTAVVDGLVERGWLERSPVVSDRRAARITLTPEGRRALDIAEAAMVERVEAIAGRADQPEAVMAGLAQLGAALERVVAERVAR